MKIRIASTITVIISILVFIHFDSSDVSAEATTNDVQMLYQKAISEKKVNPNRYTFQAFQENYNLGKADYFAMKNIVGSGLDYKSWFGEIANYGAFPDGEGHSSSEAKTSSMLRGSQTSNGNKLKKAIRKGDILIVSSGGTGHAAIATSDNYILEMTGGGNIVNWTVKAIKNNNHQFSKDNWIFGRKSEQGIKPDKHIAYWIQLWRVPNKSIANKAASYADKIFWNSNHKYEKNKKIDYRVTTYTSTKNPNYCSKLVFQAYYYGTGNANVIQPQLIGLIFVSPSALPNTFTSKYAPKKIGTY